MKKFVKASPRRRVILFQGVGRSLTRGMDTHRAKPKAKGRVGVQPLPCTENPIHTTSSFPVKPLLSAVSRLRPVNAALGPASFVENWEIVATSGKACGQLGTTITPMSFNSPASVRLSSVDRTSPCGNFGLSASLDGRLLQTSRINTSTQTQFVLYKAGSDRGKNYVGRK